MTALVVREILQQRAGARLMPDQVVIDEKYVPCPGLAQRVELAAYLIQRLGAGAAAEEEGDIAEFALIGAASRELQTRCRVAVELQEVEAGRGRLLKRDPVGLPVERTRGIGREIAAKLGPDTFRFTHDGRVRVPGIGFGRE